MSLLTRTIPAFLLLISACGGSTPKADTTSNAATDSTTETPAATDKSAVEPSKGPSAEESLEWVVGKLNSGAALTEAEVNERFAPQFLKQVPPAQLIAVFKDVQGQLPPIEVTKKDGKPPLELSALLETKQGGVRAIVGMTEDSPRLIHTLLFKPAADEAPPKSYGEVVLALQKAGAENSFYVAELVKGQCKPAQNHNVKKRLGIGSAFKLWVLHALHNKIKKSKATNWDTKLPIDDALKSLPSGVLQDEKAGTQLALRDFATKMISISDNTATDHLISFVGRKNVEKALRTANHSAPAKNTPFMMTREFFALKLLASDAEIASYRKASVKSKRKTLDEMRARELKVDNVVEWKLPKMLDIEYFADGADLCNVMARLAKDGNYDVSSEVLKVLGTNAGVPVDKAQWKYMGFKGGSEPGVINLTFLGQRADDRWFVVAMTVNDKTKAINEANVANAAIGALKILGAEK